MRVITGSARGKRLATLEGNAVRPTSQRVKEAVFSVIQFDIEGRRFLDLFAGSGSMGIEALSRGAKSAFFIDNSQQSLNTVKQNVEFCGLSDSAVIKKSDYADFLSTTAETFDIAFLDPPYKLGVLKDALVKTSAVMSDYGIIICEHPEDVRLPETVNGFSLNKKYRYGKIYISLYRKSV